MVAQVFEWKHQEKKECGIDLSKEQATSPGLPMSPMM
jgi:hypothetical protein